MSKTSEWSSFPRQTIQYHSNLSLCLNHQCWRNRNWMVPWKRPRTNTQKRCPFHHKGLECKIGSQAIPGVTGKFGLGVQNREKANRYCQKNALFTENTFFQQHKRQLYTWTSPAGQHQNRLIIIFAAEDGESLHSQEKQDLKPTVAQIMNALLPNSDLNWRK